MPRVVKPAEERKAEIVDCAQALFLEKGYDATTIADILERTRLSKGAFYHHFTAKEELLDGVTERLADAMLVATRDVLEDQSITELVRLNRFLEHGTRLQYDSAPAWINAYLAVLRPENALLYQRVIAIGARTVLPVLRRIFERGVARGEFDTPDPQLAAEVVLQLSNVRQGFVAETAAAARAGRLSEARSLLDQRLGAETRLIERVLGLAPGSIWLTDSGFTHRIIEALARVQV